MKKYMYICFILLKINKIPKKKSVFSVRYRFGTDKNSVGSVSVIGSV